MARMHNPAHPGEVLREFLPGVRGQVRHSDICSTHHVLLLWPLSAAHRPETGITFFAQLYQVRTHHG